MSFDHGKSISNSKELNTKPEVRSLDLVDARVFRERFDIRDYKGKKDSRLRSMGKKLKCFHCHKKDHFKRGCRYQRLHNRIS